MYERLFDAEYRRYSSSLWEKARAALLKDPTMSAKEFAQMRARLTYKEFVKQCDPGAQYDPFDMERRKDAFLERGRARRQAVADAEIRRRQE